jgi:hypothetical protein
MANETSPHVGSADASRRSEDGISRDMREALNDLALWPARSRGPTCTGLYATTYRALELRGLAKYVRRGRWQITERGQEYQRRRQVLDEPRGLSAAEEPCSERVTNIAPYEIYDPKGEEK